MTKCHVNWMTKENWPIHFGTGGDDDGGGGDEDPAEK